MKRRKMTDDDETSETDVIFNEAYANSENFTLFQQGAEARLYTGTFLGRPVIVKERFKKTYRHPDLDEYLTAERMKCELRCLERCRKAGIETPPVLFVDGAKNRIFLGLIEDSITVREYLHNLKTECANDEDKFVRVTKPLCIETGRMLAKMHDSNIIHGDLTTSNLLIRRPFDTGNSPNCDEENGGGGSAESSTEEENPTSAPPTPIFLVLIDFGLSHVQNTVEDKAVDLYVLEKAFVSTHLDSELLFQAILYFYELSCSNKANVKKVLTKLEEVRLRGRKRLMIG